MLNIAEESDPPTLDWTSTTTGTTRLVAWHIFEQLFAYDQHYEVKPMLAAGYSVNSNSTTFMIKLRHGVKFHDGGSMGSKDVVASIKRWINIADSGKAVAPAIKRIRAVGSHAVEISLRSPYGPLVDQLAQTDSGAMIVLPQRIAEAYAKTKLPQDAYVGTGPYKFKDWSRGSVLTLAAFSDYSSRHEAWGGLTGKKRPYLDQLQFSVVSDTQVRQNRLQSKQSQFAEGLSTDQYRTLEAAQGITPIVTPPTGYLSLIPNKAKPPFDDPRIRRAANYALDKKAIARAAYGSSRFWQLDPSISRPDDSELNTKEGRSEYERYDPQKAKRLLKDAGYDGRPIRYLVTKQYDYLYNGGQAIAQQLKDAGFAVELKVMPWATLLDTREKKQDWELFSTEMYFAFDPTTLVVFSPDYAGWYSPPSELKELFKKWLTTDTAAGRKELMSKIQAIFYHDVPTIKICNAKALNARQTSLSDYTPWLDVRFWNTGFPSSK